MSDEKNPLEYQAKRPKPAPLWWHFIYSPTVMMNWLALFVGIMILAGVVLLGFVATLFLRLKY